MDQHKRPWTWNPSCHLNLWLCHIVWLLLSWYRLSKLFAVKICAKVSLNWLSSSLRIWLIKVFIFQKKNWRVRSLRVKILSSVYCNLKKCDKLNLSFLIKYKTFSFKNDISEVNFYNDYVPTTESHSEN